MKIVKVIGSRGGIGSDCVKLLTQRGYQVTTLTSDELDLNYPEQIFKQDFSDVDILLNCAGHNRGTYRGFLENSWQNQMSQITVNYASNLFLFKHFANSRKSGKYVWLSSAVIDRPTPYQSVYGSTKLASKFAFDLIRQEATHMDILEIKIGLVRSNFRYNNFEGTQTREQISSAYDQTDALNTDYVAAHIVDAIDTTQQEIYIK